MHTQQVVQASGIPMLGHDKYRRVIVAFAQASADPLPTDFDSQLPVSIQFAHILESRRLLYVASDWYEANQETIGELLHSSDDSYHFTDEELVDLGRKFRECIADLASRLQPYVTI